MFRCGFCKVVSVPGDSSERVVVETRPITYPYREKAHLLHKDKKRIVNDDPGGKGTAIVKEIVSCIACAHAQGESNGVHS